MSILLTLWCGREEAWRSSMLILFPLSLVVSYASEVMHFLLNRGEMVFEFAQMFTNLLMMDFEQSQAGTSRRVSLSSQVGVCSHLSNRHASRSQTEKKGKPVEVISRVAAMTTCHPSNRRK